MQLALSTPVRYIKGVGPMMEKKLERLGIFKAEDLILHLPRRYQDFSRIVEIKDARINEEVTIRGLVWETVLKRSKTRKRILEVIFSDPSGTIRAVWFNQPYLQNVFKEGSEYYLSGKVTLWRDEPFLENPSFEPVQDRTLHTAKIVPIYSETEGVSSKYLRKLVAEVEPLISKIQDDLPIETLTCHELIKYGDALGTVHFPKSWDEIKKAEHTLGFREIYFLLLSRLLLKNNLSKSAAPSIKYNVPLIKELINKLPFKLTKDQKISLHQILKDIREPHPMSRLLQGDVGSGKTVVAAIAMLLTAKSGYRSAFMAPTEILAQQHFKTISELLNPFDVRVSLLTASKKGALDADVIVGTHALIQENVNIQKLAFAIVDEQHRFGVKQRATLSSLRKRGSSVGAKDDTVPHMLTMTATPIPRTLALTLYGDLDISTIREMPEGRKKIDTQVIENKNRAEAYKFLNKQIADGRQAFVITPLIDESDTLGVKSVKKEFEKLDKEVFPHIPMAMLHGKMKPAEKEKIMREFKDGKYKILVATPVIEVGIDVPNATVMIIESAQRFGLAQLHQFRGRVGRGEHQSYCFIFTDGADRETYSRFKSLEKTNDGFELAELDLRFRGPGESSGIKQSGYLGFRFASIYDQKLISEARESAIKTLETSPDLSQYSALKEKITSTQELVLS